MKSTFLLAALMLLGFSRQTQAQTPKESIEGTWRIVSCVIDGRNALPANNHKCHIEIANGKWVFSSGSGVKFYSDYQIDVSKQPQHLDLTTVTVGMLDDGRKIRETEVLRGIYRLDGSKLQVALGEERPSDFTVRKSGSHYVLERLKASGKTDK